VLSAEENISLPVRLGGGELDRDWLDRDWLKALIETVRLGDRRGHRPAELSGREQQRVAVARALITRPTVMFADEPTGNLDSSSGHEVLELLRRTVDQLGQTIVMVTHDASAAAVADSVLFLADGQIVERHDHATVDQILDFVKALRR
jgi:putative ABC transport system ATP-binding protein